ncbi:MAG TPA: multiheme c-type cytochrome [Planctomycetota bacterium]
MMNFMRAAAVAVVLALAAAGVSALAAGQAPAQEKGAFKYAGIASCSTKDCHGSETPKGSPALNEYPVWKKEDPHSKTFTTLYKGPSKAMGTAMKIAKVTDSPRCISCHSKAVEPAKVMPNVKWAVSNGVSCEVCHGPGEQWLMPHATPKEKNWSHEKSVELGMIDLRSLPAWAASCASCHLQIEHDMITAGHPKLLFEMVDYNARTGAHWKTEKHPSMAPGFDQKAWAVGQVVSLAEALRNLEQWTKASAPPERLAEAKAQAESHQRLLKHLAGYTPSDDPKAVEAQASKVPPGDDALLAKVAAEDAPKDFMGARQVALAFRALSTKAAAKADIDKLCEHIVAKNEPKFDAAKFAADFDKVKAHFK